jgi:hypothetical protein
MKKIAILSLSLVALSGTAGLGLSALHGYNMDVQTSALSTPDNIPSDSGFVIPEYVPDAAQFAAFALAPVTTATLGDTVITPEVAAPTPLAPAVRAAIKSPGAVASPSAKAKTLKTADINVPAYVAETQSFAHTPDAATKIDYIIGVYR